MKNYWKIALQTTAIALFGIFVIRWTLPLINPIANYNSEIFAILTVMLLLYSLTEFFITTVPAEINGTYRRIPVLGTTTALSLAGVIVAIPLGPDFYLILGFNFMLFVASLLFITHILIATVNTKQNEVDSARKNNREEIKRSPLSDPDEVQRLFYMSFSHAMIALSLFLALSYLLW